jgi:hypothetical protein
MDLFRHPYATAGSHHKDDISTGLDGSVNPYGFRMSGNAHDDSTHREEYQEHACCEHGMDDSDRLVV